MAQTAVITGASSGIGEAFAHTLAQEGYHLLLTARNQQKLESVKQTVKQQHGIDAMVYSQDLTDDDAAQNILQVVADHQLDVAVLINNAGSGRREYFSNTDAKHINMTVDINVRQSTLLAQFMLCHMQRRGGGRILNVASLIALAPSPHLAVYGATKCYLHYLSQAIAEEVTSQGITVTSLCPGPVATPFIKKARLSKTFLLKWIYQPQAPERVAQVGYRALCRGRKVCVPGWQDWIMSGLMRCLPNWVLRPLLKRLMQPS